MKPEQANQLFADYVEGWLKGDSRQITKTLTQDCLIIESHGPRFEGKDEVLKWVCEWNQKGSQVIEWKIKKHIFENNEGAFQWFFRYVMENEEQEIDGISFVEFKEGKISKITEYMRTDMINTKADQSNETS